MNKWIFTLLLLGPTISFCQIDSLRARFASGQSAYQAGDYVGFLNHMIKANEFRPYYPPVMYNIAAGYSLIGKVEESADALKTFLSTNSATAFEEDSDFQNLKNDPAFEAVQNLKKQLSEPLAQSTPYLQVAGTRHAESMAYDSGSRQFYLGDVRARKIVVLKDGKIVGEIGSDHPDFYSVMGLDIDSKKGLLWICTASMPQMVGYQDSLNSRSSLFSYNVKSKLLTHHVTKSASTFGDLIVGLGGQVLISDGNSNIVYGFDAKSGLTVFADVSRQVFNLQGLALSPDQKWLYCSDYISGLYRISVADKKVEKLSTSSGTPFKGIDGLYTFGNTLIGIENGSKPMRVIQYQVAGTTIERYSLLDQNQEFLNEPTQGAFMGSDFIYIANSPWGLYDKENNLPEADLPALQLRKLAIKE